MKSIFFSLLILFFPVVDFAQVLNLVSSNPEFNASNVSISQIISLDFSESIDPTTAEDGIIVLSNLRGILSGNKAVSNQSLTFQPIESFYYGETIIAIITQSLKSLEAHSLASPTSLHFTTLATTSQSIPPAFLENEIAFDDDEFVLDTDAADIDKDGDLDIFYSSSKRVGWLENIGPRQFLNHSIETGSYSQRIRALDFDADQDTDFVVSSGAAINLYVNDGDQEFSILEIGFNPTDSEFDLADFDSNGFSSIRMAIQAQQRLRYCSIREMEHSQR